MLDHLLRGVPQVSKVLECPALLAAREKHSPDDISNAVRAELEALRLQLRAGTLTSVPNVEVLAEAAIRRLETATALQLRSVINATGIVLHTNLGRSPIHEEAAKAAYEAARGYLNLEMDLESGMRSSRQNPIREGVCRITGAEDATVVNNCAAATVIVLRALAAGREVIVSRGQLIEIGGSFRIPDIMTVSGAILREVGTTNITRASDYADAINPKTGLLMRIHCSNYRIRGFTETPSIADLVMLGKQHGIPVVDDAGSGCVPNLTAFGLSGEPLVSEGIRAGADLVLFSGDKLLGGPQAGIIAGRQEFIRRIERDPLMRAFRCDKMTLAALEVTLRLHRDPRTVLEAVPTLRLLTTPLEQLTQRCHKFAEQLKLVPGLKSVEVHPDTAYVGGGSLPDIALPTAVIQLQAETRSEEDFARRLRLGTPAAVGRVQGGKLILDLRTVFERQEIDLIAAIRAAVA